MKNNLLKFYLAITFIFSNFILFAQGDEDSDGVGHLEDDDLLPIDNYIWILVLVGLIFVFFKFRSYQQATASLK